MLPYVIVFSAVISIVLQLVTMVLIGGVFGSDRKIIQSAIERGDHQFVVDFASKKLEEKGLLTGVLVIQGLRLLSRAVFFGAIAFLLLKVLIALMPLLSA